MTPEEKTVVDAAIAWSHTYSIAEVEDAADALQDSVANLLVARDFEPRWFPGTFGDVLANDRIRLGGQEAAVLRCSIGIWHADTSDAWRPKAWEHAELRMELDVNPGFIEYPASTPCEIECSPERAAILALRQGFPGSSVIS